MAHGKEDHGFNANKIFWTLFILTAVEVVWAIVFKTSPRWLKWGGLLGFAFWKGALIYMYFMHMKFEGPVVKWLMRPTPVLIAVVVFALMPDVSVNDHLVYPVGTQLDRENPTRVIPMPHTSTHGEGAAPAKH